MSDKNASLISDNLPGSHPSFAPPPVVDLPVPANDAVELGGPLLKFTAKGAHTGDAHWRRTSGTGLVTEADRTLSSAEPRGKEVPYLTIKPTTPHAHWLNSLLF